MKELLWVLLTAWVARAQDPAAVAEEVLANEDLSYTTGWTAPCGQRTWDQLLAAPLLMGKLWAVYGYAPAYRTSALGDTLLVADPTGLEGKGGKVRQGEGELVYLIYGKLDHWAVPFFNRGLAVIALKSQAQGGQMDCQVEVHIRAESSLSSLVLQAGRSLVMEHVQNRVTLNLADAANIFADVQNAPEAVRAKLSGEELQWFESTLSR
ncbi:MAG: hypothetical protein HYW07_06050 [Candidatus Latescibacteria bacterium]|nr:hypothetical protein [Candidatus Latescibacterota bacterium]